MKPESVVERLYEAASLPELWPAVLEEFGTTVGTPNAILGIRRHDGWVGSVHSPTMQKPTTEYFASDVPARSEIAARLVAANHAGFVRSNDVFTPKEWEKDPFRHEWARKWGFNHGIATAIQTLSAETLIFHIQRREGEPSFDTREVALLDSFRPHLARAGLLAARLRLERLRAATEALGAIGLPAAVLGLHGRVLVANDLIEGLTAHVRWLARDRIALIDPNASKRLAEESRRMAAGAVPIVGSFVSRPLSDHLAVCHVIPTPGQARDLFLRGSAILMVSPVAEKVMPGGSLVESLFDLSPAEALVARGIAEGASVAQMAMVRGTSVHTVRTQMKSVLAKMGLTRQSQVAAVLASLPAFLEGP